MFLSLHFLQRAVCPLKEDVGLHDVIQHNIVLYFCVAEYDIISTYFVSTCHIMTHQNICFTELHYGYLHLFFTCDKLCIGREIKQWKVSGLCTFPATYETKGKFETEYRGTVQGL